MKTINKIALGVSAGALLSAFSTAHAQQDDSADTGVKRMDSVVITAERRETTIIDTPIAVTAVSSEQRDLLGILDQTDLANYTPGMTYQASPNRITIRGIGRLDNAQGTDPGVATYVDGVYTSEAAEISRGSLFIERTEVLRGPQGTLFGRNAIGGLINIISKKPEFDWGGEARLRYGSNDTLGGAGTVTGPLSDNTAFRFNVDFNKTYGASQENTFPGGVDYGKDDYHRIDFLLTHNPSDDVSIFFRYAHAGYMRTPEASRRVERFDYTGPAGNPVTPAYLGALAPSALYGLTDENPGVSDPDKIWRDYDPLIRLTDNHAFTWEIKWEADFATVKYLGSQQNYDWDSFTDADGTARASHNLSPLDATSATGLPTSTYYENYVSDNKRWNSHEIQLISNGDGPFQWIAGLYTYHETASQPYDLRAPQAPAAGTPVNVLSPFAFAATGVCFGGFVPDIYCGTPPALALGEANPNNNYYHQLGKLWSNSEAAYVQADFDANDKLSFKAGVRYTHDEKRGYEEQSLYIYDPYGTFGFLPAASAIPFQWAQVSPNDNNRHLKNDWHGLTGNLGVNYNPTEDTLLYAQYSRGYKAGGMRLGQLTADNPTTDKDERFVDEETVDAYEIGAKGLVMDSRLQFAASAFLYDYQDQQVPVNFDNNGVQQQLFLNLPESRLMGLELETAYQPTDNFRIGFNYGYLNTEITSFPGTVENTVQGLFLPIEGNSLPRSPEHSANINATYTMDLSGKGALAIIGDVSHVGDQHTGVFEDDIYTTPAHQIANLRAIWTSPNEKTRMILSVNNVFDDDTEISAGAASDAGAYSRIESGNRQRTFFVELQRKF